ncbi:GAF domain-containing protein [Limimaricola litoreus]|uniref:GAF domain-containing protein n=1 Tax=Limimaricola litoreus TaxID=2955316 RepID=A0A9X2FTY5_9RHOB|nr:GAF domain-containing protein [Limimaricola litoreus]MCP1170290.1 GAF domain-containing protein [Limimaricola litoreus]
MTTNPEAQARFRAALTAARAPGEAYAALQALTQRLIGARLFTVMTVDMGAMLARRAYTSHPVDYPASGTKPIEMNDWFEIVHGRHESFVANRLEEIDRVFPDAALIGRLGCGSVMNLPILCAGELVATVNMLDAPAHFTPARVALAEREIGLPALAALLVEDRLAASGGRGKASGGARPAP